METFISALKVKLPIVYNSMSAKFDPSKNYLDRRIASSTNRKLWLELRKTNITATDIAALSGQYSIPSILKKKMGRNFGGNVYTEHGNTREPIIAAKIKRKYKITPNNFLYHAENSKRFLATPDGVGVVDGEVVLSEIKTTNKALRLIPSNYLRQIYWQQYVLGASRTLFVWEQHEKFIPIGEPTYEWVERDDSKIEELVELAGYLLETLDKRLENPSLSLRLLTPSEKLVTPAPSNTRIVTPVDISGAEDIPWD